MKYSTVQEMKVILKLLDPYNIQIFTVIAPRLAQNWNVSYQVSLYILTAPYRSFHSPAFHPTHTFSINWAWNLPSYHSGFFPLHSSRFQNSSRPTPVIQSSLSSYISLFSYFHLFYRTVFARTMSKKAPSIVPLFQESLTEGVPLKATPQCTPYGSVHPSQRSAGSETRVVFSNSSTKAYPEALSLTLSRSSSYSSLASSEISINSEYLPSLPFCDHHLTQHLHNSDNTDSIHWTSIFVIYFITVVAEAARGLLLPSSWPYFHALGGNKADFGFLVATYSFGRMLSTTPLGYLSDAISPSTVLVVASAIQALGHFIYATAPNVQMLYLSRIIVGFGSATTSIARAHITKAIPQDIRTTHFAYLSGLQFVGIAVLPVFGGLLSILPHFSILALPLNGYTYPAHLLVLANLACIPLIMAYYIDPSQTPPTSPLSIDSPSTSQYHDISKSTDIHTQLSYLPQNSLPSYQVLSTPGADIFALFMCLLINVVFRGILAALETVSVPFLMEQFHVTYSFASACMSCIGLLGLGTYFSFKIIASKYSDRVLVSIGLTFIALGCLPLSSHTLVSYMNVAVYVVLLAFTWSIAYPIGQTAILSLYSKLLAGFHVGGLIGLFSTSGALSPLFLSVIASRLWENSGRESVFGFVVENVLFAVVILAVSYKRLVPPNLRIWTFNFFLNNFFLIELNDFYVLDICWCHASVRSLRTAHGSTIERNRNGVLRTWTYIIGHLQASYGVLEKSLVLPQTIKMQMTTSFMFNHTGIHEHGYLT